MSWQASDYVRQLRGVSASEKSLLYSLADRHNTGDKGCWPSIATIADEAGLNLRATQRILHRLAQRGILRITERERDDGSRSSNFYSFVGLDDATGGVAILHRSPAPSTGGPRTSGSYKSPIEPPNEKKKSKEKFDKVHEQLPTAVSALVAPARYWDRFGDNDLPIQPDNVVAAVKIADKVRGRNFRLKAPIRVPVPGRWSGLDRVGAFFLRKGADLDIGAVELALEGMTTKVKAGPAWDNVLDIIATYPEEFLDAYREATP